MIEVEDSNDVAPPAYTAGVCQRIVRLVRLSTRDIPALVTDRDHTAPPWDRLITTDAPEPTAHDLAQRQVDAAHMAKARAVRRATIRRAWMLAQAYSWLRGREVSA